MRRGFFKKPNIAEWQNHDMLNINTTKILKLVFLKDLAYDEVFHKMKSFRKGTFGIKKKEPIGENNLALARLRLGAVKIVSVVTVEIQHDIPRRSQRTDKTVHNWRFERHFCIDLLLGKLSYSGTQKQLQRPVRSLASYFQETCKLFWRIKLKMNKLLSYCLTRI